MAPCYRKKTSGRKTSRISFDGFRSVGRVPRSGSSLPPADSTPPRSVEISCLCAPALFDTPGNEVTLDRQGGEIFGLAKTRERGGDLTEFGSERATDGVVEIVALQRCALLDAVERVQPDLCAVDTGDGDGTVHRSDR